MYTKLGIIGYICAGLVMVWLAILCQLSNCCYLFYLIAIDITMDAYAVEHLNIRLSSLTLCADFRLSADCHLSFALLSSPLSVVARDIISGCIAHPKLYV